MKTNTTILGATTALLLLGCTPRDEIPSPGHGVISDLAASAIGGNRFGLPLDATMSPDGKTAYFTALTPEGNPAILTSDAPAQGEPRVLAEGFPLVSPLGIDISSDGQTLVVADAAADFGSDQGRLFILPVGGGLPSVLAGSAGFQPKQLVVVSESAHDVVYFTGQTADHGRGIFKIPLAGGTVVALAQGEPWIDPSGIAVASNGDVYVLDINNGQARLLKLTGDSIAEVVGDLRVGYPAGVALSQDEKVILISALDAKKGTDAVARVDLSHPQEAPEMLGSGIDGFNEPAGLKRAKNVDTYIWADSAANGQGTVFVINKQN